MKNLKIGVKLLITFLLIIVMFCITVFMSIRGLNENAEKYSEFYNVGYKITNKVMSMRRGLKLKENVNEFVERNPQIAAKLLQSWLKENDE